MPKQPPAQRGASEPVFKDGRFKNLHTDPRFDRRLKNAKRKEQVKGADDERFSALLSDPRFRDGVRQVRPGAVDKRGRSVRVEAKVDDAEDAEEEHEEEEEEEKDEEDEEDEEDEDEEDDDDDSDAEDNADLADLDGGVGEWGVGYFAGSGVGIAPTSGEQAEDVPRLDSMKDATKRLAIVDCDWDHVRAVDLFAALSSFADTPRGGRLVRVAVYPSDYGLKRMAEEERDGPRRAFAPAEGAKRKVNATTRVGRRDDEPDNDWDVDGGGGDDDDDDDDGDNDGGDDDGGDDDGGGDDDDDDDDDDDVEDARKTAVSQARLRAYERSRLRYYYAIATFTDAATARAVYAACDGVAMDRITNSMDLRFVPKDSDVEKTRKPRDVATSIPADYAGVPGTSLAPNSQKDAQGLGSVSFAGGSGRALDHTSVKLTWDCDDFDVERKRALRMGGAKRLANDDELAEDDMRMYLASPSVSEDDDEEHCEDSDGDTDCEGVAPVAGSKVPGTKATRKAKLRAALTEGEDGARSGRQRHNGEMTVTFGSDGKLDVLTEGGKGAKTIYDRYVKRREEERSQKFGQEAKHGRHRTRRGMDSDDDADDADGGDAGATRAEAVDLGFDDPFFLDGSTHAADAKSKGAMKRRRRDAESDTKDDAAPSASSGKAKGKKKAKVRASDDAAAIDVTDDRFAALYEDADYALDPTNPNMSRVSTPKRIIEERKRRRKK